MSYHYGILPRLDCAAADLRGAAADQQVPAARGLLLPPVHGRGRTVSRVKYQGTPRNSGNCSFRIR